MIVIEMRKAMQDKVFDLVEEVKDIDRKRKMVLCELEDTLYECFESGEYDDEEESEESDYYDEEKDYDMEFKGKSSSYGMRSMRGMRHGEMPEDEDKMHMFKRYRNMRSRRNRAN